MRRLCFCLALFVLVEVSVTRWVDGQKEEIADTWHPTQIARITDVKNGCLIAAVEYESALLARDGLQRCTWARIVRVKITGAMWWKDEGHAVCVFALRNGDVWAYDILNGSTSLHTRKRDLATISTQLRQIFPTMQSAVFLD